jgi:hypothetical protein
MNWEWRLVVEEFMNERCDTCGELLNNSPDCDPQINGDKGCANVDVMVCDS